MGSGTTTPARHADGGRGRRSLLCPELDRRRIPTYSSYTDVSYPYVVPRTSGLIPKSSPGHPHLGHRFVPRAPDEKEGHH